MGGYDDSEGTLVLSSFQYFFLQKMNPLLQLSLTKFQISFVQGFRIPEHNISRKDILCQTSFLQIPFFFCHSASLFTCSGSD